MFMKCLACEKELKEENRMGQFFQCDACKELTPFTVIYPLTFETFLSEADESEQRVHRVTAAGTWFLIKYLSGYYLITARHNFKDCSSPYKVVLNIAADFNIYPERYVEYEYYNYADTENLFQDIKDIVIFELDMTKCKPEHKKYLADRIVSEVLPENLSQEIVFPENNRLLVFGYSTLHGENSSDPSLKLRKQQACIVPAQHEGKSSENTSMLKQLLTEQYIIENGFSGGPVLKVIDKLKLEELLQSELRDGVPIELTKSFDQLIGIILRLSRYLPISACKPLLDAMQSDVELPPDSPIHIVHYPKSET